MDIHLGRGNANKIMNRLLWNAARAAELSVVEIDGGGLRNAIPRESQAVVVVSTSTAPAFEQSIAASKRAIQQEYATTDADLDVITEPADPPSGVLPKPLQQSLLGTVYACPCGIHRMCPDIEGLVQTSNNLARVLVKDGRVEILCLTRSSVNSERDDLAHAIKANFDLTGADTQITGAYPGWQPAPSSAIVTLMSEIYTELFGDKAHVAACHAGLECGIIGRNYPDMDMISFGPTIRGAHSPDERVCISSVQKYWSFLLETLKRIPAA